MVEFNPDGSIKLPEQFAKIKKEHEHRMRCSRCIKVKRDMTNFTAPKKCLLNIKLSDAIDDNRFVEHIYYDFKEKASVPSKFTKINDKEFEIEIGTDFRRCTDCNSFVNQLREFIDGNMIDEKSGCTYEGRHKEFCYEDYFD